MKERYEKPEWHRVGLDTDRTGAELAAMDEDQLRSELERSGFYTNKVLYRAADDLVTRGIAGETVIVPTGEMARKLNGMATFTETGQYLWKLLSEKPCTKDDLAAALAEEYQCKPEDVREDVCAYLEKMAGLGFAVTCG